ncbi:unnamed protein product [Clonostachys byssicola]|uniref:Dihydroxyacetone kinase n=1 Tax=Clonostachys byssicola TaxID=160290 RepID=A0A9N9Y950_9HYPO|nr:unnamed protein product [Clonostachys byssicola]
MSNPSSKHFLNDPQKLVTASLRSLTILNPTICLDVETKVVYLAPDEINPIQKRVSVLSGGGSGHEPSFGAMVGKGFLDAAACGSIFASPNSGQILSAIHRLAHHSKEILVTVMNYTGDVLNFGVAIEKFKTQRPGISVKMLIVGDDAAVPRSRFGKVGRRGTAGTVLVHKATGALASLGYDLDTVAKTGQLIADNIVTIGVALDRVHVPGRAEQAYSLAHDEVELGMGIHNEPGCALLRASDTELPALVNRALLQLLDCNDEERGFIKHWSRTVVLMVNNLGGLSALELGAATAEIVDQLNDTYGITPKCVLSGTFMASLDCRGFSITLLNVVPLGIPHDILSLLGYPTTALGWAVNAPLKHRQRPNSSDSSPTKEKEMDTNGSTSHSVDIDMSLTYSALRAGLKAVVSAEPEVTRYDTIVGDGDCGTTLSRGATGILEMLSRQEHDNIVSLLSSISASVEETMDGTSGAIYSILLNALTQTLQTRRKSKTSMNAEVWAQALRDALTVLSSYTPARPGDRTLLDALVPFIETLEKTKNIADAADAAQTGAKSTQDLKARLGRAVYVGNESEWLGTIPDPGAWGLQKFLMGLADNLKNTSS